MNLEKTFKNKKVIVTGHTGFKGSWLTLWLTKLGANVLGISKNIPTKPSHFESIKLKKKIRHKIININNYDEISKIFKTYQPSFVFHLAAQSLVSKSYDNPIETFNTNAVGTLNILESLKQVKKKCVVVIITSDKVYKNLEITKGYKEDNILGGKDPYSGSKAAAENIINSYIHSYFDKAKSKIFLSIARAGNVIGGGDWSQDRIVPDCIKSWSKNKQVIIRNPNSTRPWQHVLEAVGGYLIFGDPNKIGGFQNMLQRHIVYTLGRTKDEMEEICERLFADDITRSVKSKVVRTRRTIILIDGLSHNKTIRQLKKSFLGLIKII